MLRELMVRRRSFGLGLCVVAGEERLSRCGHKLSRGVVRRRNCCVARLLCSPRPASQLSRCRIAVADSWFRHAGFKASAVSAARWEERYVALVSSWGVGGKLPTVCSEQVALKIPHRGCETSAGLQDLYGESPARSRIFGHSRDRCGNVETCWEIVTFQLVSQLIAELSNHLGTPQELPRHLFEARRIVPVLVWGRSRPCSEYLVRIFLSNMFSELLRNSETSDL